MEHRFSSWEKIISDNQEKVCLPCLTGRYVLCTPYWGYPGPFLTILFPLHLVRSLLLVGHDIRRYYHFWFAGTWYTQVLSAGGTWYTRGLSWRVWRVAIKVQFVKFSGFVFLPLWQSVRQLNGSLSSPVLCSQGVPPTADHKSAVGPTPVHSPSLVALPLARCHWLHLFKLRCHYPGVCKRNLEGLVNSSTLLRRSISRGLSSFILATFPREMFGLLGHFRGQVRVNHIAVGLK